MVAISDQTYNPTREDKIQRSFTKHITEMNNMPYYERLKSLCREEEKGTALSIFGKLLRACLLIFLTPFQVHF